MADPKQYPLISKEIADAVRVHVKDYHESRLQILNSKTGTTPYVIKFVNSQWAKKYSINRPDK